MAQLGITIKSDFAQASKDLKNFKANSKATAVSVKKFQDSFKTEQIDRFLDRQKRTSAAVTATRGRVEAAQIEYRGLRNEIERLIKRGIDPNDKSLQRLNKRYNTLQKEIGETTAASKKLSSAQRQGGLSSKFAANAAALGAKALFAVKLAAVAAAASIVKNTFTIAKLGDEYSKASRRIGITAEDLQELTFAADRQGVSGEELTKGLEKLNKNVGDLKGGYGALNTALKNTDPELLKNLKNAKNNEEAWNLSVDALQNTTDEMSRASLAQALFGRSGLKLLTVTEAGVDGIAKLRQEARDYGIISNESARRAEDFVDAQTNLTAAFQGLRNEIGIRLFPVIQKFLEIGKELFLATRRAFTPIDNAITKLKELDDKFKISTKVFATYAFAAKFAFNIFKVSFGQAARVGLNLVKFMAGYIQDFGKLVVTNFKQIGKFIKDVFDPRVGIKEAAANLLSGIGENFKTFGKGVAEDAVTFAKDFVKPYKDIQQDFKNFLGILTGAEQNQVDESGKLQEQKTTKAITEAQKRTKEQMDLEKVLIDASFQSAQIASDLIFELNANARERDLLNANEYTAQLNDLNKLEQENQRAKLVKEIDDAKNAGDLKLVNEKELALKRFDLEKKETARALELQKKAAKEQKRMAVIQAIINGALAIGNALATVKPFIPNGLAAAGIATGKGIAEVATIRSQTFQTGTGADGLGVRTSGRAGQDTANIKVADGENVNVTARGESSSKDLTVNVQLEDEVLFRGVQRGIDSGEITVNSNNIQQGVFGR